MANQSAKPIAALAPIIGLWNTVGKTVATPTEPSVGFEGTDRYDWINGGNFILHSVDVSMDGHSVIGVELIGFDAASGHFLAQFQDDGGNPSRSSITFDGRNWRSLGETERFDGTVSADGQTVSGHWQRSEPGGEWRAWMDVTLKRAT